MKIRRNRDVPFQKIVDEVVIVAPRDRQVHRLDEVASHLWMELERPRTVDELVRSVTEEFDVDDRQARKDIRSFVDQLRERNLVE